MHRHVALFGLACLLSSALTAGCGESTKVNPSATGSTLGSSAPKSVAAKKFVIDTNESKVSFVMNAPSEKIRGRAAAATSGELYLDPTDLSQTTGTIAVDLDKLELFQRVKGEEDKDYQDEQKSLKQNEHARDWLQINEKVDADQRKKNARCEYKISAITSVSQKDITKLTGAERTVQVKSEGTLLLHGHTNEKVVADLEVTFKMDGDKIVSTTIKTKTPIPVSLAEYEVKPRDALGTLLAKGLDALSNKVAKEAPIEVLIVMKPDGMPLSTTPPPPDPTPIASVPASAGPSASAAPSAAPK